MRCDAPYLSHRNVIFWQVTPGCVFAEWLSFHLGSPRSCTAVFNPVQICSNGMMHVRWYLCVGHAFFSSLTGSLITDTLFGTPWSSMSNSAVIHLHDCRDITQVLLALNLNEPDYNRAPLFFITDALLYRTRNGGPPLFLSPRPR